MEITERKFQSCNAQKRKAAVRPPFFECGLNGLEAELRSNRHAKIVVSSVVEEDIVTCFQPKTNRSRKSFNTSGGIKREICCACTQPDGICKPNRRVSIRDIEI